LFFLAFPVRSPSSVLSTPTWSSPGTLRMLWAYEQKLDPLHDTVLGSALWSTLFAGLPVFVLFYLLVPRRWLAPKAGLAGAITASGVGTGLRRARLDQRLQDVRHGLRKAGRDRRQRPTCRNRLQ